MKQNGKLPPSMETFQALTESSDHRDTLRYRELMGEVDWSQAPREMLNHVIGIALGFQDTKQAKSLTEIAYQKYPENEMIARTWRMFNPRPAGRFEPKKHIQNEYDASVHWLQKHFLEYASGHWVAVEAGQLIADAPTYQELNEKIEAIGGPEILTDSTIIHRFVTPAWYFNHSPKN